jgi:iron complex transport system substrate-binding protein
MTLTRRAVAAGAAAALAASPALASAAPRRVVSLNPCLDVIVAGVADRSQIAALSHYAHEPDNTSLGLAGRSYPITYESAEEIIALSPDLVLMARHSAPATRAALQRLGVGFALYGVPETVEASLSQVREIGVAVGHPHRGEAMAARIEAAVARAAPAPGERRLTALVFQSGLAGGSFVSAEGTLMDDMLRRTGFINAASRYGLKRTGNLPLEKLIADPPDVLLAGARKAGAPSWADRVVEHPALARIADRMHRATFPQRLMFCGGPVLIETAGVLAKARREAQGLPA